MTELLVIIAIALTSVIVLLMVRVKQARDAVELASKERDKARTELERAKQDALARLDDIEAEIAAARAALEAEREKIREHYEGQLAKELKVLAPLQKYAGIADAEGEARRLLDEALTLAQRTKDDALGAASRDRERLEAELAGMTMRVKALRAEADGVLLAANQRARDIADEAVKRAEEIAGDAYRALRERDQLDEAVKAIRNVIEGYGDRYVVPTHSIVDELAADYSHTEAGEKLRQARDHTERMVQDGVAADCDYAEARRKETAIRFVLDAFNGHVDAILARSRHDNVGTLTQEIRDEFALVNLNGEAFRNARVRPEYLDARLEELKWAVATHELRQRERDEQRRIQEQIREEEKARREIERALKDSAKQEEAIRKALEEERAKASAASADDRRRLELHIAELSQQLADAEAKNQRALSMAQQTRAGVVYIISNVGSFGEDVLKIGMTRRMDPQDRIRELGDASVPFTFDVHAMIQTDDAPALERELHDRFADQRLNRVNYRKEFFRVPIAQLRAFVTEKGLPAAFTMAAEAREYRESLAVAKNGSQAARTNGTALDNDEDDGL